MSLQLDTSYHGSMLVVRARGAFDDGSGAALLDYLRHLVLAGDHHLVLDLREVAPLDDAASDHVREISAAMDDLGGILEVLPPAPGSSPSAAPGPTTGDEPHDGAPRRRASDQPPVG